MSGRMALRRYLGQARAQLQRLGVDVVRYPVHTTLDGHLRTVIGANGVSLVLDVGANTGQFADRIRQVSGYQGRIVSFEPTPDVGADLARRVTGDGQWELRQVALGSRDETMTLHLFDGSDWNSLHEPDLDHLHDAGRALVASGTSEVPVRRLDGLWDELVRPGDAVLMKSDTQGHDLEVIEGAGTRLGSVSALLVEASLTTFYRDEPTLTDLVARLADLGFVPSGFFPVTRRRGSLALDTVDVCFVPRP